MTSPDSQAGEFSDRGRHIHGPTPPGGFVPCERTSPLSDLELERVVALIGDARRARRSAVMPLPLRTRAWRSVGEAVLALEASLSWRGAGWKVGGASEKVRQAEGLPGPSPGRLFQRSVVSSGESLDEDLFINYRLCECEFAFEMAADFPVRSEPYSEVEVVAGTGALIPAIEVGDSVFEDWYAASAYFGACYDNGGGAAFVMGPRILDWQALDLSTAGMDLFVNYAYVKSGVGATAMGNPVTSLTWMVNWLRERGVDLRSGEVISTGTCTGHCFVARGDSVRADFGPLGVVAVRFS